MTPEGEAFNPGNYYYVGGNSKLYGAVLLRYRAEDFRPIRHLGGTTPGWPIGYDDLEPWYQRAEELYRRPRRRRRRTRPSRGTPGAYPFPPVPDEPSIADRAGAAEARPASTPVVAAARDRPRRLAEAGGDAVGRLPGHHRRQARRARASGSPAALEHPNVTLETGALVTRLDAGADGPDRGGRVPQGRRDEAAGARARDPERRRGQLRRAAAALGAREPLRPGRAELHEPQLLGGDGGAARSAATRRSTRRRSIVNDFYLTGGPDGTPLGNIQLLGKVSGPILAAAGGVPEAGGGLARRPCGRLLRDERGPARSARAG